MSAGTAQNILITGLPRSGTTLTCHLLNKIPNSVALHEPLSPNTLDGLSASDLVGTIQQFCAAQRQQILHNGTAVSNSWDGTVPTNPKEDADEKGRRKSLLNGREITVSNVTREDFSLYVKQPAFFTAALPVLTKRFSCFAIIRNPLAVLLSWRTAGMPVTQGRMPAAEMFEPSLATLINAESNVLEKQFILLDFCFSQYGRFLAGRTVRYEEIIRSGGSALSLLNPAATQLDQPLESRNLLGIGTDPAALEIGKRLIARESPCWSFYQRADVEALMSQRDPAPRQTPFGRRGTRYEGISSA